MLKFPHSWDSPNSYKPVNSQDTLGKLLDLCSGKCIWLPRSRKTHRCCINGLRRVPQDCIHQQHHQLYSEITARHFILLTDPHSTALYSHLFRRLFLLTILRKPVGSVTEFSLLFISSYCWSMISPASLSVSLLAQALQREQQVEGIIGAGQNNSFVTNAQPVLEKINFRQPQPNVKVKFSLDCISSPVRHTR